VKQSVYAEIKKELNFISDTVNKIDMNAVSGGYSYAAALVGGDKQV